MKKKIISAIVVIIIILVIIGIWFIKNIEKNKTEITNEDFSLEIMDEFDIEKLKSYNLPIIIDFGSDGCMPCREMFPAVEQLNKELQGKAIVRFIDVWKYPDLAKDYPIELIPTQMFINSDGTPYTPENADELGLEFMKDENGKHIYTMHVGGLTFEQMKTMLKEMGLSE